MKFLFNLTLFLFCLWLSSCSEQTQEQQEVSSPNVVIILVDDQGWGDLSMNGNPIVHTPNIDGIAKKGVTFDRFYVHAVCSPTRASLLTGRYAIRGGVYSTSAGGERLDLDETTIAQVFQKAGYQTGAFGKWHNGMQAPYHPNMRGFDEFYGYCSGHWGSYFDAILEHNGRLVKSEGYLTDVLTDKTIAFIEAHKEQPFFAYLPLNTPHSPMQVPDRWWNKFAEMDLPEHRYSKREADRIDHTRAAYAMAENIDWNVGRVLQTLKEQGLEENTMVLYFSDNGPNGWRWNGGMEGIKGSTNEGGVRSPLVLQWPGKIKGGQVVPEITSVMDLFPTLISLAGIEDIDHKPLDGKDISPLLVGEATNWPDRHIVNHWRDRTSVRSQQFRLDDEGLLFDMANDPGQTEDVAAGFPELHQALLKTKQDWEDTVLPELPEEDLRPFVIAHLDYPIYQLPARDAIAHGGIKRSNRWPNCSFYTNWTSLNDSITWDAEVLTAGTYQATLYYTCQPGDEGAVLALSWGDNQIRTTITEAIDPPLRGGEHDRFERGESYVKDFKPLEMGTINLSAGKGDLSFESPRKAREWSD